MPQEEPNPLMRKKKTPEELAAEAEAEDEDEFTSMCSQYYFDIFNTRCFKSVKLALNYNFLHNFKLDFFW